MLPLVAWGYIFITPPGCHINIFHCQRVCCLSRAWRRFQDTNRYSRRAGSDSRGSFIQQDQNLLLCARKNGMKTSWATTWHPAGSWCDQTLKNRFHEGSLRASSGPSAYCLALWTWFLFAIEDQNWQVHHWRLMPHRWSAEAVESIMMPVTLFSMTNLVVGQWLSEEAYQWRNTDLYRLCNIHPNCHILSHICTAFYANLAAIRNRKKGKPEAQG